MAFYEALTNLPPVLDFEASSLDIDKSYPISLGLVAGGHSFEWLIKPKLDWTDWSAESESLHRISRARLLEFGIPAVTVNAAIIRILGAQRYAYTDAYEWDGLWARRLGLENIRILPATNLVAPDRCGQIGEQRAKARIRYSLRSHNAVDDALALAFAIQSLQ